MQRCLHVVSSADRRGAEVFATELDRRLRERGLGSSVVALSPAVGENPLDIHVIGAGRRSLQMVRRLAALARNADVVVSHGGTTLIPCLLAASAARRPFVYRNIGDPGVWGAVPAAKFRVGLPLRRACNIAALYPQAGEEILRRYGVRPERVVVIPNAADPDQFLPADAGRKAAARDKLGLSHDAKVVGWVGALSNEKRPLLAIEAAAQAGAHLVMAGSGPLATECRALCERGANDVMFLGQVADPRMIYAAADLILMPSITEGLPATAIEAALCGLPVVASNVGGLTHVIDDRTTGILVDEQTPQGFVRGIADAFAGREHLGAAARIRCAELFSFDNVADLWLNLLLDAARH